VSVVVRIDHTSVLDGGSNLTVAQPIAKKILARLNPIRQR